MKQTCSFILFVFLCVAAVSSTFAAGKPEFIRVSKENPAYFEYGDGTPYIPIGVNLCILREYNADGVMEFIDDEARGLAKMEFYFQQLAKNGGNYCRIWLGSKFFEIERTSPGKYEEAYIQRFAKVLKLAEKYDIRLKLCIEHYRTVKPGGKVGSEIFLRNAYVTDPPLSMKKFMDSPAFDQYYLNRCKVFAERFSDNPYVFAWELWNEVNCIPNFIDWTAEMLPRVHKMFPKQMVIQSLGSYDKAKYIDMYRKIVTMKDNDIAQVHRYLDPGAQLDVCRGPMDSLAADMTASLLKMNPGKPVLTAEMGAVQWRHAGPSELYDLDHEGILLHDVLFTPFFCGAAGSGHCWHWYRYIEKQNLWWHIGRFSKAIAGVNPIKERFEPFQNKYDFYKIYGLKGKTVSLLWLRSQKDNWKTELIEKKKPETFRNFDVDITGLPRPKNTAVLYDPWTDTETPLKIVDGKVRVPQMTRSTVLRVQ
ncbi:MAG: cellulase family glycosylhydrolase [Thermoguttaceae bacterium]|nr:cellulase family glycosylhydrolase [Thermoguttaceae bacterium]